MKTIKIREKEINVKTTWNELTIKEYLDIINLQNNDDMIDEEFAVELIYILSGLEKSFLYSLYTSEMNNLSEIVNDFNISDTLKSNPFNKLEIDGIVYTPVNVNELTTGETISLKIMRKDNKSELDNILNMLSILIRPGKEVVDEFGETKLVPVEFDGDIDVLKKRKEIFKNINAENAIWILENFTGGKAS